jgi:hypothetical protein
LFGINNGRDDTERNDELDTVGWLGVKGQEIVGDIHFTHVCSTIDPNGTRIG